MPAVVFRNSSAQSPYHCQLATASDSVADFATRCCADRRLPARGTISRRRIPHAESGSDDGQQIHDAEDGERPQRTDLPDESRRDWRGHQRARSESGNGDARDHAATIRKPFHEGGDWNDVAEPETDPAQQPVGKIEPPEPAVREAREEHAEPVQNPRRDRHDPWAGAPHPEAPGERREPQYEDRDRERQRDLRNRPTEGFRERNSEHAPRIDRSKGDLHDDAGSRDHPSVRHISRRSLIRIHLSRL